MKIYNEKKISNYWNSKINKIYGTSFGKNIINEEVNKNRIIKIKYLFKKIVKKKYCLELNLLILIKIKREL